MYKCNGCGEIFETPSTCEEYRGEFWGSPSYETMECCPHCGEDFEEIECDENGIIPEIEKWEYDRKDNLMLSIYSSEWYYEKCDNHCEKCKFFSNKKCEWQV